MLKQLRTHAVNGFHTLIDAGWSCLIGSCSDAFRAVNAKSRSDLVRTHKNSTQLCRGQF